MQPTETEPTFAADERRMVERAIAGDAQAFAALCETHRKRVWRVAASVTKSAADADDLAQEAFVRAFGAIRSYRPEASFAAWLCRIALNAAHDYQKSAWRRRVLFWSSASSTKLANSEEQGSFPGGDGRGEAAGDAPHREVERREIRRRVRAAVAQLKPTEGTPIWMIYFEEFTLAEVARLEGEPESTVRSRVRAGLKRLEKMLGDMRSFAIPEDEDELGDDSGTMSKNLLVASRRTATGDRLPDKRDMPLGPETKGYIVCR